MNALTLSSFLFDLVMDEVTCGPVSLSNQHHILLYFRNAIVDVNSPKIAQRMFTNFKNLLKFMNFNSF